MSTALGMQWIRKGPVISKKGGGGVVFLLVVATVKAVIGAEVPWDTYSSLILQESVSWVL